MADEVRAQLQDALPGAVEITVEEIRFGGTQVKVVMPDGWLFTWRAAWPYTDLAAKAEGLLHKWLTVGVPGLVSRCDL